MQADGAENTVVFTEGQQKAVDGLVKFINSPFKPSDYIRALVGPGGSGKSFIVKWLIKNCKYTDRSIQCCAPTHKACRVLANAIESTRVDTVQSVFGLRLDLNLEDFDPANPQFNPKAVPHLEHIKVLIIDEASMIPAKLFAHMCSKCRDIGIKLLVIGDASQLSPVNERKSTAFLRAGKVFKLTEIVRQDAENPMMALLNMLRYDIDHRTYRFVTYVSTHVGTSNINGLGEGYSICPMEGFRQSIDRCFGNYAHVRDVEKYRIVAYTNRMVNAWNAYVRGRIIPGSGRNVITGNDLIMSYETIVNRYNKAILTNSEEYIVKNITNFIDETYRFRGFNVQFQSIHGGDITMPLFVLDHKDRESVMVYHNVLTDIIRSAKNAHGSKRVEHWKEYYEFKKKYLLATNILDNMGKTVYERDIDYAFAITSHRAQGSTYDNVFVDMTDIVYDRNGSVYANYDDMLRRLYVACSRARKELIIRYG